MDVGWGKFDIDFYQTFAFYIFCHNSEKRSKRQKNWHSKKVPPPPHHFGGQIGTLAKTVKFRPFMEFKTFGTFVKLIEMREFWWNSINLTKQLPNWIPRESTQRSYINTHVVRISICDFVCFFQAWWSNWLEDLCFCSQRLWIFSIRLYGRRHKTGNLWSTMFSWYIPSRIIIKMEETTWVIKI